ncbi:hypothetical protein Ciccas_012148 [Cichlidogyrus casuarinus]|uniref:G-protein coupled receptors family 1 profile domain-containing protein n=1 Tax=Cichlidogyrus casuarinus TaxID=1844966 RepID=A0ABD2PU58_9PLAT
MLMPCAFLACRPHILSFTQVSTRDKPFSRQSSNTSKSSSISNPPCPASTTEEGKAKNGKQKNTQMVLPEVRLITNSNSKLHLNLDQQTPNNDHNIICPDYDQNRLYPFLAAPTVPSINTCVSTKEENSVIGSHSDLFQLTRSKFDECRRSTSSLLTRLKPDLRRDYFVSTFRKRTSEKADAEDAECQPILFATPQPRRKSSGDVYGSKIEISRMPFRKNTEPSKQGNESSMEAFLSQLMRNQHRRTWRILLMLLLVFVVCRAPKMVVLVIGWLNRKGFCEQSSLAALHWLNYASLWAHTSTILDPIVYGFWGNRAYRIRLQQWLQTCGSMFCRRNIQRQGSLS